VPAYWVILVAVGFVLQSASVTNRDDYTGDLFEPSALLSNMFFVQNYRPSTIFTGVVPAWSLSVEVVFYVTLPLLALVASRLARRASSSARRRFAALAPAALLLVIGLSGKAVAMFLAPDQGPWEGWKREDWYSVLDKSFWCQADLFAFGCALAVVKVEVDRGKIRLPAIWRRAAAAGAVIAYLIAAHGTSEFGDRLGRSPYNTLVAFACALLVALAVLPGRDPHRPPLLVRVLEARPLVAVGVASYSVFLWHQPIIDWLHDHGLTWAGRSGFAASLALTALITGALSTLTWRYVERPALALKAKKRPVAATPAVPVEQLEAAP
jgi:peptidoglycan/LPS O-acetylase OafA/YrhL